MKNPEVKTLRPELTQEVLLVLVQPAHSLHQLPLLAAAFVVDKVPGEDFLQLSDAEQLDVIETAEVGQGGPATRNRGLLRVPGLNRRHKLKTQDFQG